MSTFTLGDKTAAELGLVLLRDSQIPILPNTVDRTLQIPGRHGAYNFGADLSPRLFELECAFVDATTQAELQTAVRTLVAHLLDTTGRPRDLALTFEMEPDKSYTVRYSGSLEIERIIALGLFTLPLVAYDPFAYGAEESVVFVSDSATVDNTGAMQTYPVFEVTFTVEASEWRVTLGTGEYIRVVRDFVIGDELVVNCATGAVIINGVANMSYLDWENSEFFPLQPGENTLDVTPLAVCDTTVKFKPRWL